MLRLQQQQMLLRSKLDRVYEDRLSEACVRTGQRRVEAPTWGARRAKRGCANRRRRIRARGREPRRADACLRPTWEPDERERGCASRRRRIRARGREPQASGRVPEADLGSRTSEARMRNRRRRIRARGREPQASGRVPEAYLGSQTSEARMAPQVGFEPTTLRLTAGCSAIELLRNSGGSRRGSGERARTASRDRNRPRRTDSVLRRPPPVNGAGDATPAPPRCPTTPPRR